MSLASKLPWTHRFSGGYPGIGSQPLPTDADAIDYLTRVAAADGAGVEVGVATAVDAFVAALKADSLWESIGSSCLLCGPRTLAGALVPLRGDAPTGVGLVSGDYNRQKVTGDGTSHILSGLPYNEIPANDEHMSVYVSSLPSNDQNLIGGGTVTPASYSRIGYFNSQQRYELQAGQTTAVDAPFQTGFVGASRPSGSSLTYRNGGSSATVSRTSAATRSSTDYEYAVLGANYSDLGVVGITDGAISFYSIGSSLDLAKLDTHITAYVTAIGAAL